MSARATGPSLRSSAIAQASLVSFASAGRMSQPLGSSLIWPLLCGLGRAKFYLWNLAPLTGKEAERIGLVTKAMPLDQILPEAFRLADQLAQGPQHAIRGTKRAINGWLRQAMPIFEHSAALEMTDFFGADVDAARKAFRAKQPVKFPSAK